MADIIFVLSMITFALHYYFHTKGDWESGAITFFIQIILLGLFLLNLN